MRLTNIKKAWFWGLLIAGILGLAFLLHASTLNTFEFNPDEGTNLIKAKLALEGFDLYKQIWSDQPPLFTALLSFWFRLFGASVYSGRLLVLFFSLLFLCLFYLNIRIRTDRLTAMTAVIFLILSSQFLRLSVSVMIGLPSLAWALLSLYFAAVYSRSGRRIELWLSSIFMAFSLLTKFFTIFLAPIILMEALHSQKPNKKLSAKALLPALSWISGIIIMYSLIILAYFYPDSNLFVQQLFKPHISKIAIPQGGFSALLGSFIQDYDITLLAILGLAASFRVKTNKHILFPGLWLGLALLVLIIHRPVWDHYYTLLSIPMCWLAAVIFVEYFRQGRPEKKKTLPYYLVFALVILTAARIPFKFIDAYFLLNLPEAKEENKILDLISKHKQDDKWIFTDLPVYAFKSGLLVPPETAVLTSKRLPTTELTIQVLKRYKPRLILLGRFQAYDPEIITIIQKDYYKESEITLFRPWRDMAYHWRPAGLYLPRAMWQPRNKWLYDLIWSLKLPGMSLPTYLNTQKITLYVHKNTR
jgi:4-amino-4-deoxy-L-arabinose transferase-like glycosyltransferase